VAVTSVGSIVPGKEVILRGKNLARLESLVVAGQSVPFTAVSDRQVKFTAPSDLLEACDVDGRAISVVANGVVEARGALAVPPSVSLKVGESRILSEQEVSCLQLPAGNEEYLFHVSDLRTAFGSPQTVFRLRTRTAEGGLAAASGAAASAAWLTMGAGPHFHLSAGPALREAATASGKRIVVEPRLATAQVGDTIRMLDLTKPESLGSDPDKAAYLEVVILAVSGDHVIASRTDYPGLEELMRPAKRQELEHAAAIIDKVTVPAVRAVIDPNFVAPQGAGGRTFTLFDHALPEVGGSAGSADLYPQDVTPLSHEIVRVTVNGVEAGTPQGLASLILHQMGHAADALYRYHQGLPFDFSDGSWYTEAIAEQVIETAARIAIGQELQADLRRTGEGDVPGIGHMARWPSRRTDASPFHHASVGPYDTGARLLLYARQKLDLLGLDATGKTLHQRLREKGGFGIQHIAEVVGMSPRDLLAEVHLAELTDDLIGGSHTLPQIEAWDNTPEVPRDYSVIGGQGHVLSRTEPYAEMVVVSAGNKQYWYVPGERDRGLTLQVDQTNLEDHHQVRLTRLR